jgi:alpha-L-rhamnosidase
MIQKRILCVLWFLLGAIVTFSQTAVVNLRTENMVNPIGIEMSNPAFSWQLRGDRRNIMQNAYEIKVAKDAGSLNTAKGVLWNSGKVQSEQSLYIPYAGPALSSGQKYFWQVRVWDNSGKASEWSAPAHWQTALLSKSDWKAKWISPGYAEDTIVRPSPLLRKTFQAGKKVKLATAYISALGLYEAFINGKRVGDAYLTPGWTNYAKRIQYQQYDVTDLMLQGDNAMGAALGSGWYRGFIGFSGQKNFYGKELALLFQLELLYADGTSEVIVSDDSWKSSTAEILTSEIYHGETIDHRKQKIGWNRPDYNDADWTGVKIKNEGFDKLLATYNEPVRRHESFKPVKIFQTPNGEQVIDFGQNLVGWVTLKANGKTGDKITVYHAEVLDKKGNFYTENLRPAKQQNVYKTSTF